MKEILDFIKESVNSTIDRLRFPLFNSFLVSWIVFNWKPVFLILFSEESLESRIAHVTFHYSDISHLLYYPALTALLYTFLTPMLKRFIGILLTDLNKENRDSQYDYVIDSYIKKNILAAKQYEYQLSKEGAKKVEELSAEIETLRAEKENLQNEKIQAEKTIQNQNEQINGYRTQIAELVTEKSNAEDIGESAKTELQKLKEILERERDQTNGLRDERHLLYTERDLDRKRIENLDTLFKDLMMHSQYLVDEFINLQKTVPNYQHPNFEKVIQHSRDRLERLESDYNNVKQ